MIGNEMKIYLTRHGQTKYNKAHRMQGRIDEPLNETGRDQAGEKRALLQGISFDAVYASPLDRAQETACLMADVSREDLIIDERIIETDFGPYETVKYYAMGPAMTLYWALPEVFPAPKGVESIEHMVARCRAFLRELEQKKYETVLITCHGGIMRVLSGVLLNRKKGILWRPKPHNCEVRVFEQRDGHWEMTDSF